MTAVAAALVAALLAQSDVKEIKGRVVDGDGKPVAGVPIAPFWTIKNDVWAPGGPPLATSGDDGAFAKKVLWPKRPTAYLALDKDGKRGGVVVIDNASVDGAHEIRLAPLASIKGAFNFKECGATVPLMVSLMAKPAETFIGQMHLTGENLQFRLPPGEYALRTFSHRSDQRPIVHGLAHLV